MSVAILTGLVASNWLVLSAPAPTEDVHVHKSTLPLPVVDANAVSVSGISSGADAAVQLQVAYSSVFVGVGVFAGQAYHCAVHRFPDDQLGPPNPSVPYCDSCPAGQTLTYDHCKRHPEWAANVTGLVEYAKTVADARLIDPLSTLSQRKAFLYRGKSDTTYNKGSVNATANFFRAFMNPSDVYFETKIDSPHLVPGIDPYLCWWEEWGGPDNCTYDGAGEALKWIYGKDALSAGRSNDTKALAAMMTGFDQRKYFPDDCTALMADKGKIFVPQECQSDGANCKLHIFLHGCGVTPTFPVFTEYGGFNEWAAENKIVVLYPKMGTNGTTKQESSGCWDGYGQTGSNYDLKSGCQMRAIVNMVTALTAHKL